MNDISKISVAIDERNLNFRVVGRGDFRFGRLLQEFLSEIPPDLADQIGFDFSACQSIDSTFAGILTMQAFRLRPEGGEISIANATPAVLRTLKELGVNKLFNFTEDPPCENTKWHSLENDFTDPSFDGEALREVMLLAHVTLGDVNDQNQDRFADVIEALKSDLP